MSATNTTRGWLDPGFEAVLLVVYDLRDPAAWETANRHRNYWGKTHTRVHYLEENVIVLAFHPAPDQRWRPWEGVRLGWILEQLQGRGAGFELH